VVNKIDKVFVRPVAFAAGFFYGLIKMRLSIQTVVSLSVLSLRRSHFEMVITGYFVIISEKNKIYRWHNSGKYEKA